MGHGFAALGLVQPKSEVNVGSVLRAAQCYGAAMVAVTGKRFGRCCTDTMAAYRSTPFLRVDDILTAVPFDCVPVAVELTDGATSILDYTHPQRAFYIFGPEDSSIPKAVLARCRDVIMVPTEYCMNLAATANVVLYDRLAKMQRRCA
jgi:tRNA(Leu) C34 or U34 (ribose-2'-O)-methylase TrmL